MNVIRSMNTDSYTYRNTNIFNNKRFIHVFRTSSAALSCWRVKGFTRIYK